MQIAAMAASVSIITAPRFGIQVWIAYATAASSRRPITGLLISPQALEPTPPAYPYQRVTQPGMCQSGDAAQCQARQEAADGSLRTVTEARCRYGGSTQGGFNRAAAADFGPKTWLHSVGNGEEVFPVGARSGRTGYSPTAASGDGFLAAVTRHG